MSKIGLLIDFEYCTGCHSCEVACRNEKEIGLGKWGIKLTEVGPFEIGNGEWEWSYIPVPTKLCDLCEDRIAEGKKPACVHHCPASVMDFGPIEELVKKMEAKEKKVTIFLP